jgi:hypothetical protein
MSRFKRILLVLTAVFLLPLSGFNSSAEGQTVTGSTHADIQKGAVPENVVFHGRLERDGAPYNGNIQLKLRIYTSASAGGDTCICYADNCSSSIVMNSHGCIWESSTVEGVKVEQGLFHQSFSIPMSVLGVSEVSGQHIEKYYSIISDAGTVAMGQIDNGRMLMDSAVYALAAKGLEEKTTVVLSTVVVAQSGNIYLNTDGTDKKGAICFKHPGSPEVCQNNSSVSSSPELISDAHVFINAVSSVSFYAGDRFLMYISQDGNVGIGTSDPQTALHVGSDTVSGLSADVTIVDTSTYSRILGNPETGKLSVKEIQVSTITNTGYNKSDVARNSGIFFYNDSVRFKAFGNTTQPDQLVLSTETVMINTNDSPVNTAGEALRVNGNVYASEGIISNNIYISTDNEISIYGGNNQDLSFNNNSGLNHLSIGAQVPVDAALYVSNGGIRTDTLDVGRANAPGHVEFKDTVYFYGDKFKVSITTAAHLGDTIIYGNLKVDGSSEITSPAYIENNNVFHSTAVFNGEVFISTDDSKSYLSASDIFVAAGGTALFNEGKYLQIGDAAPSYSDRNSYLALNSSAGEEAAVDFYRRSGNNNVLISSISAVKAAVPELHIAGGNSELVLVSAPSQGKHQVLHSTFTVLRNGINTVSAYTDASSGKVFFGNAAGSHAEDNAIVSGQLYVEEIRFHDGTRMSSSYVGDPGLDHIDGGASVVTVETSTGVIRMQNSGSNVLIISTSGKAGIGLNNPSQALALSDSGSLMVGADVFVPDSSIKVKTNNINTAGSVYAGSGGIYTNDTERINNSRWFQSGTVWDGSVISLSKGGTGLSEVAENTVLKVKNNSVSQNRMFAEKLNLADTGEVDGVLAMANGGTGRATAPSVGPLGISNTGTLQKKTVRLAVDTENVLGISHGGFGPRQPGETGILVSDGVTISSGTVNLSENISGTLNVARGGTGKDLKSSDHTNRVLYADTTANIKTLQVFKGRPIIGRNSAAPVAVTWQLKDIKSNNSAEGVNFSIPQSVSTSAYVTFAGLKFGNPQFVNSVLKVNSGGRISTHTIILKDYLNDTLSMTNGGTGTGGAGNPLPSGLLKSNGSRLVSGTDHKLNMSDEVSGILAVNSGGTGISTFNKGNIPVYSAGSMNVLALGSSSSGGMTIIGKTGTVPVVADISGTTNRVYVDKASGSMTVRLPQNISETSSPGFGNLKLTDLNGFVKANGADGNLSVVSSVALADDVSGVLPAANGGTGSGEISEGILRAYNNGFSNGSVNLGSSGDVSGVLPIENGGFNHNIVSDGKTGMLKMWGSSVTVAALDLNSGTADYDSGTVLALANGGTGNTSIPAGVVYYSGVKLTTASVSLTEDVNSKLNVANGGTGLTVFQANKVITVNDSGAVETTGLANQGRILAGGTEGNVSAIQLDNNTGDFVINSNTPGSIQLSAVQGVKESDSPVFAGIVLNGTDTAGGILYADSTGSISTTTLLITEHLSSLGTVAIANGGTGLSSIASGPVLSSGGAIINGSVSVSDNVNGTLSVSHGGTGIDSINEGGLVKAVSSSELAPLYLEAGQTVIGTSSGLSAAYISGAANQVDISTGSGSIQIGLVQDIDTVSTPEFAGLNISGFKGFIKASAGLTSSVQKIALDSDMTGTLGVNRGGTGQASISPGILFQSGIVGMDQLDLGNSLYTQVSGILPVANGGLGADFTGSTGVLQYNAGVFSLPAVNIESQTTGNMPVNKGGFGSAEFNTKSIVTTDVNSDYVPLELPYAHMLAGGASGSEPAAASFVPVNGITVSTSVFVSSVAINLGLPQPLHSAADVTFDGMTLLGYSGIEERFLKLDLSLMPAQSPLLAVVPQFTDIQGIFGADKGGTGSENIPSGGIVYFSTSAHTEHISLSPFQILLGNSSGQPVAADVIQDNMTGVSVAPANPPDISTIVVSAAQDISSTASPSFTGMTLNMTGLNATARPYLTLDGSKSVTMPSAGAVLARDQGGTGVGSLTQNDVLIVDQSGYISGLSLPEGRVIIKNNSGDLVAGRIEGTADQVIVSTVSGGLQVSLPQNLASNSDVQFSSVSASFNIETASMTINGDLTAGDLNVNVIRVGGLLIPVDTNCSKGDSGVSAGQIKFCKTRNGFLGQADLNKLVFYDGSEWRCANNGKVICTNLADISCSNCYQGN